MAKDAKLVFVLSGDTFAKKKVVKFLSPSMGRRVIDVGNNVERAAAFKLCGNGMIASIIELLAEGASALRFLSAMRVADARLHGCY